ncbi:MAG: cell division protein FtsH [candidate division Zixibacteria bacterium 4484_93]|nr:MAG: cell division protein FtsH [candidate division Zixibacteria bacterium 4484_93]
MNAPEKKKLPVPPPKPVPGRGILLWVIITTVVVLLIQYFYTSREQTAPIPYSEFISEATEGNIDSVAFIEREITGRFKNPREMTVSGRTRTVTRFKTYIPFDDPSLVSTLTERGVKISSRPKEEPWYSVIFSLLPWLIFVVFLLFMFRQMQGNQKGIFSFGKSRAKRFMPNVIKVTFADVAGVDEAKEELEEIIQFLKNPKKFTRLGGRIPKGVLLVGPPGTGKTLLAKAVAGEAKAPFFHISGSDFVEMFVGVGASRVRDLFNEAKRSTPCIVFIDEIDAVGRHRGAGLGGGHDEREQTLNQLLVEMDGFEPNDEIIVLAATNRPDVLDPALLRPGRFDRRIVVNIPDVKGREEILKVHIKNIILGSDVNLSAIARATPGLTGADLASIVNEAALLAARKGHSGVLQEDFEDAKDKIIMGVERKTLVITPEEKKVIAYHEAGHALVAKLLPGAEPVYKVTIIPRGVSLGVTHLLPRSDRYTYSRSYLVTQLTQLLGGRAAELLVFKDETTGAGNDIERATQIARKMVTTWGMSRELGPVNLGGREEQVFLGMEVMRHDEVSEKTRQTIDSEIALLVQEAQEKALSILEQNIDTLHRLAGILLEREVLDAEQVDRIIRGEEI